MCRMTYRGRWLVLASFVLWALCAFVVVAWLSPLGVADTDCEFAAGSSRYGEASRSLLPPGTTCTYPDLRGLPAHIDSPSSVRLLVVAMAVVGPFVSAYMRRVLRASPQPVGRDRSSSGSHRP
jgi:hypothetical protein